MWYSADGADPVHPLLVVMLALAMDVALGDPPRLARRIPHPVAVFGGLISLGRKAAQSATAAPTVRGLVGAACRGWLVVLAGSRAGIRRAGLCAQINYGWVFALGLASG